MDVEALAKHLLGKDSYEVLVCKTAQVLSLIRVSASPRKCASGNTNYAGAESYVDVQMKCMLVPRKAFINSHNLRFEEAIPQISYLGRFFHLIEDPVEKLPKPDMLTDAVYCYTQKL
jgi:hypothetical protein